MPRGVYKNPESRLGRKHSQATKDKIAAAHRGKRLGKDKFGNPAVGFWIDQHGYKYLTMQYDHPLANGGNIGEHRFVLFEKIGYGPHKCHWCPRVLAWGGRFGITADHVDGDVTNNSPENLVPSCYWCNRRGARVRNNI